MNKINTWSIIYVLFFAMGIAATLNASEIHTSIIDGDLDKIRNLLEEYPDLVNIKNENGWTPLYIAVMQKKRELAEFLISKGADVDIFSASSLGLTDKLKTIIEKNPAIVNSKDSFGRIALHCAANKKVAEVLISKDTNIHIMDKNGWMPLHQAAFEGRRDVAELLISKGADVDIFVVSSLGMIDKAKELLEKNPGLANAKSKDGSTPLHIVSTKDMAELLISKGANVNISNKHSLMPLHIAVIRQFRDVVVALITNGADVNARSMQDWTPLHWAAMNGYTEIAKLLIKNGAIVNVQANRNDIGQSPLHKAAQNGHKYLVEFLIKHGAKVDITNSMGETPLFGAADKEVVEILIAYGANVNHVSGASGWAPLHEAVNGKVAEVLVARGANINTKDNMNRTPLDIAVEHGKIDVAKFLISRGAKGKNIDMDLSNEFSLGASSATKADMNIFKAASLGLVSKVKEFLDADPELAIIKGGCAEETPLHDAATKEIAELLIQRGANINVSDVFGRSPLHRAAEDGRIDVVKLLITKGADVNARDGVNNTALHGAAHYGHKRVVEILIESGADLNVKNIDSRTPLHWAVEMGYREIVELLVSSGASRVK